jgi:alkanesulfonate monooxygenase SsuD/methylene tetrahydromethanopterin reductase-like flavin-dependent oxidoreductase (luciferase family)
MARHGIKGIIGGGVAEGGALQRVVEAWRDAIVRAGREAELGTDLSIGFHFYLADDQRRGIREAAKYFEENLKMFGPLRLVRTLTDAQIEAMADPRRAPYAGLPRLEEAVQKGAFLCGPADLIVEQLKRLEERYPGLERVSVSHPVGTPQSLILEQLEQFAVEVLPAFKRGVPEPVSAS